MPSPPPFETLSVSLRWQVSEALINFFLVSGISFYAVVALKLKTRFVLRHIFVFVVLFILTLLPTWFLIKRTHSICGSTSRPREFFHSSCHLSSSKDSVRWVRGTSGECLLLRWKYRQSGQLSAMLIHGREGPPTPDLFPFPCHAAITVPLPFFHVCSGEILRG